MNKGSIQGKTAGKAKGVRAQAARKAVQAAAAFFTNAHLSGFVTGSIYSGALKKFCVPGMNCYSCPAALFSCPIGAMQALSGERRPKAAFSVLGFLTVIGVTVGRFVCGWLCLFGLIQELLYKIPVRKITVPEKADRVLRYLKYAVLLVFVILLPIVLRDEFGFGIPYFCKWICPVGMLEGGIPLLIVNKALRPAAHFLYAWKLVLLLILLVLAVFVERPFCKYVCPLGAVYALFARISFLQLSVDRKACVSCGKCRSVCPMQVDPSRTPSSAECIRCGLCADSCPESALRFTFAGKTRTRSASGSIHAGNGAKQTKK